MPSDIPGPQGSCSRLQLGRARATLERGSVQVAIQAELPLIQQAPRHPGALPCSDQREVGLQLSQR